MYTIIISTISGAAPARLADVGLADRADHDRGQLSGGQMQRVAIARALVGDPALLLVDEPTGNLDLAATAEALELLDRRHAEGRTIVMITHEEGAADHADRRLVLVDGRLAPHIAWPLPAVRRPSGLRIGGCGPPWPIRVCACRPVASGRGARTVPGPPPASRPGPAATPATAPR